MDELWKKKSLQCGPYNLAENFGLDCLISIPLMNAISRPKGNRAWSLNRKIFKDFDFTNVDHESTPKDKTTVSNASTVMFGPLPQTPTDDHIILLKFHQSHSQSSS